MSDESTYTMPEHGWTCFHCGETFTTSGSARDHFGAYPSATPGCMLKVELGAERGLLMALRKTELELARYMEEDGFMQREMYRLQSRHAEALSDAEEIGYRRGLRRSGVQYSIEEELHL